MTDSMDLADFVLQSVHDVFLLKIKDSRLIKKLVILLRLKGKKKPV